MNRMKCRILLQLPLLLLVVNIAASAQQADNLSLEQAIEGSIKNSKQLKISNARIADAMAVVQEAKDGRLPNFNVSASYLRLGFANIDLKKNNSGTGGTAPAGPAVNPSQAMYGIANLSLPLYAGGRIKYGIESANYLQQAVQLDADVDREAVIYNASSAYVNLFKAQQAVAIVKAELNASLARDSNLVNLEQNGILARNDLLKSQLQTSNIETGLLEAENNLELATVNMNLMLGRPEATPISIDTAFTTITREEKTFAEYESLALQNRKDVLAVALRARAAAIGIKAARAEAYPTLALTGGYVAAHIPDVLTITNAVNFGVGVQYNLASIWKKNTKLMQAKAREAQVNASEEILNDGIKLGVTQDYKNYTLSKKKIEVYEKAVGQAAENYRIVNNKFNNSLATITDLLEANVALLQAKLNIQAARADAVLAYQKLLQTTGSSKY